MSVICTVQPTARHADAACKEHPELNWYPERGAHVRTGDGSPVWTVLRSDRQVRGPGEVGDVSVSVTVSIVVGERVVGPTEKTAA